MKSSDLTIGKGYAYRDSYVHPDHRPHYQFQCVVPLAKRVHHLFYRNGTLVMEPGRKALGYGTDVWNTAGKPYIEGCGVPCMVARHSGHITPSTEWLFKLINPRFIWEGEWEQWDLLSRQAEARRLQENREREEKIRLRNEVNLRLQKAVVMAGGVYERTLGGFGVAFNTTESMTWLADLLEDYVEVVETLKDIQYEMED